MTDMQHEFRPGLEFDVGALERHFAAHLPRHAGALRVRQFPGGQSNPTYLVESPGGAVVLRRKPPGVLLPSAHAVDREHRVLAALARDGHVPVARPLLMCDDAAVIGTPFYVMERLQGRVFWDPTLPELPREDRRAVFDAMGATLATLHNLDPAAIGLADFGRAEGYVARQVARWSKQYFGDVEAAGRVESMERVIEWLPRHAPATEPPAAVVHGDYRLDNLMFAQDAPRVIGVLDWELSTIGNPHADFAYHLMMYRMPPVSVGALLGQDLEALGLPAEQEYVADYCARRGLREVPDLGYYMAFCLFRMAGILHGIRGRVQRGTAVSPQAKRYAAAVETVADLAWRQAQSTGLS
jgi:aminoglycoside phosphotransferase (APT) family kinase protein